MSAQFGPWLAAVTASEVAVILASAGWLARKLLRSAEQTRETVQQLKTYVEIDKVIGPRVQAALDDLGDVVNENTRKLDVLNDWRRGHENWHERHDVQPHRPQVVP